MAPKEKRAGQQKRTVHYSSHLRVMNVDNATAAPSVLLFFDRERYLFNAGEGIQRHFFEHKQRLKKVTHVLATRVSTDTLAGLPGMLLSQVEPGADYGKAGGAQVAASVTGPAGLRQYVDAFRMYASSFALDVTELGTPAGNAPIVSEGRVTITPLLITPVAASSKTQPAGSKAAGAGADAAADTADGSAEPAAKKPRHEGPAGEGPAQPAAAAAAASGSNTRGTASVHSTPRSQQPVACYVCQFASIPGKFDPQKAAQLGVPKGPLFGQLQRGSLVTAVNGRVVQPYEVMNPPTMMGPCVIVVDCPSLDYLPALQADPTLLQLQQDAQQQQQQQQQQQGVASQPSTDTPAAAAAGAAEGAGASNGQAAASESKLFVVVHLGPAGVSSSSEYRAWCAGFGRTTQQLFVSGDAQLCTTTRRAAQLQAQLNVVEPEVFSMQGLLAMKEQAQQQQVPPADAPIQDAAESAAAAADAPGAGGAGSGMQVYQGAPDGLVYKLMPPRVQGLAQEDAITQPPDLEAIQAEVRDQHPKVMQLLQEYTAAKAATMQQQPAPQLQGVDRQTAAVTPLGTCSACPSNHRNVSAYYLDLFDQGGLLMDCGEDTMGQLERRYGRAEAERRILQLHAIWISHMHADHHGGLYPLLLRRQALLQQHHAGAAAAAAGSGSDTADGRDQAANRAAASPLLIMGPFPLFRVLCQYSRVLPLSFTFLPNSYFFSAQARQPPAEALAAYEAVKVAAGLAVLEPFPVQHVANSSGLQLKAHRGWKMVFSGDTRPCQAVIDAAHDATLLVHEATFEDELQQEAIMKKHSTTAEALGVASAANAYRTLLTHFSTRYPKIPVMKTPAEADAAGGQDGGSDLAAVGSVMVAFDLMTVNLADLPWLPKMLPVLDELLQEEEAAYDDDEGADGAELP